MLLEVKECIFTPLHIAWEIPDSHSNYFRTVLAAGFYGNEQVGKGVSSLRESIKSTDETVNDARKTVS